MSSGPKRFYHGTRADLKPRDRIAVGYSSNYGTRKQASWVYLTGTLDAAIWGAELAAGAGRERIYIVEPADRADRGRSQPDRKNFLEILRSPTAPASRSKVTGEVRDWKGHSPERLKEMKDHLERLKEQGVEAID